ncbi:unnamed protein product [Calypogeia fissa]
MAWHEPGQQQQARGSTREPGAVGTEIRAHRAEIEAKAGRGGRKRGKAGRDGGSEMGRRTGAHRFCSSFVRRCPFPSNTALGCTLRFTSPLLSSIPQHLVGSLRKVFVSG